MLKPVYWRSAAFSPPRVYLRTRCKGPQLLLSTFWWSQRAFQLSSQCPSGAAPWANLCGEHCFLLVGFWKSGAFLSSASRVLPNMVCIDWWKNFPVGLGVCLVVESSLSMHEALGAVLSPMKCKVKSNKLCAQDAFYVSMCVLTYVQGSGQPTDQKATKVSLMASWL